MNLTIGTTTIEITSCIRMRDLQRGFYLNIEIPKDNITFAELSELFDGCTESIIVNGEDGETVYNGFSLMNSVMLKDGVYHVEQCCVSEVEAQLSLAQKKISEQTELVTVLEETSVMQAATLESILLEVIPAVVSETIEALASNFSTEK